MADGTEVPLCCDWSLYDLLLPLRAKESTAKHPSSYMLRWRLLCLCPSCCPTCTGRLAQLIKAGNLF